MSLWSDSCYNVLISVWWQHIHFLLWWQKHQAQVTSLQFNLTHDEHFNTKCCKISRTRPQLVKKRKKEKGNITCMYATCKWRLIGQTKSNLNKHTSETMNNLNLLHETSNFLCVSVCVRIFSFFKLSGTFLLRQDEVNMFCVLMISRTWFHGFTDVWDSLTYSLHTHLYTCSWLTAFILQNI